MSTRQSIMAYIRKHDPRADGVMLFAGNGYFYFGSAGSEVSVANRFKDTMVMVRTLDALTPQDWLDEFKSRADAVSESLKLDRTNREDYARAWLPIKSPRGTPNAVDFVPYAGSSGAAGVLRWNDETGVGRGILGFDATGATDLAVQKEWRGKGIAEKLWKEAKRLGVTGPSSSTTITPAALAFFRKQGVSVSVVEQIDAVLARLEEKRGQWLFHTTSFSALDDILRAGHLKPKNSESFISLSENPHFGDISGDDVVLVFDKRELLPHVMQVEYDEDWYDKHTEHAAYIAGEGWREQYTAPDYEDYPDYDPDDEFWEPDPDDEAAFYRAAEVEAFTVKHGEREWITKTSRPLPLDALHRVLVKNPAHVAGATE